MLIVNPSLAWGTETGFIGEDGSGNGTPLSAQENNAFRKTVEKAALGALLAVGGGIAGAETSFRVTAGSGLNVSVAAGAANIPADPYVSVFVKKDSTDTLPVNASTTQYLLAQIIIDDTLDPLLPDSRRDWSFSLVLQDGSTLENAVVLAKITTSGSAVTAIQDLRRFVALAPDLMRPQGNWSVVTAYLKNQVVKHASAYWLALQSSINQEPEDGSAYWDLIGTSVDGAVWRDGEGVPDNALGSDGDYYLDAETGDVYKRIAGVYELRANIAGPQGVQGYSVLVNAGAPISDDGVNGDGWIDSDTGDVYKKVSGAWVLLGNLQGPPGADGATGASGGTWNWIDDGWVTATAYAVDDALAYGDPASTYRCKTDHTSGATTEPGVGVDWATAWEIVAAAGEAGTDGAAWRSGSGVPDNGTGADGDWYFDFTSLRWYVRESGAYVLKASVPSVAPRLITGSMTSNTVGTGSKTFAIPTSRSYDVGLRLRIIPDADITAWMEGQVTAYSGTTLTVLVDLTGPGSGTFDSWNVVVAGEPGQPGGTGSGDVAGPASATNNAIALFNGTTGKLLKDSGVTLTGLSADARDSWLFI